MDVLGVDPSLSRTGFAVLGPDALHTEVAETFSSMEIEERLMRIRQKLISVVASHPGIAICSIEQPIAYRSGTTTINLGMLQGVLRVAAYDLGLFVVSVNIATAKKRATGDGRSGKAEMIAAARQMWGVDLSSDEADAAFIALCGREMVEE